MFLWQHYAWWQSQGWVADVQYISEVVESRCLSPLIEFYVVVLLDFKWHYTVRPIRDPLHCNNTLAGFQAMLQYSIMNSFSYQYYDIITPSLTTLCTAPGSVSLPSAGSLGGQWLALHISKVAGPNWPTPCGAAGQFGFPVEWHLDIWCTHCATANCVAVKATLATESPHHSIVFTFFASDDGSRRGLEWGMWKHIWITLLYLFFCAFIFFFFRSLLFVSLTY